jgi:hypothetical protein
MRRQKYAITNNKGGSIRYAELSKETLSLPAERLANIIWSRIRPLTRPLHRTIPYPSHDSLHFDPTWPKLCISKTPLLLTGSLLPNLPLLLFRRHKALLAHLVLFTTIASITIVFAVVVLIFITTATKISGSNASAAVPTRVVGICSWRRCCILCCDRSRAFSTSHCMSPAAEGGMAGESSS